MNKKIFLGLLSLFAFSVSAYSAEYIMSASAPGVSTEANRVDGLRSCLDIIKANPASKSGQFTIIPDGKVGISVYCDMKSRGGGWTLLAVSPAANQKSLVEYASLAKISTEIAYGGSKNPIPAELNSMDYGMVFKIPNPSIVTFDGSGKNNDAINSVQMQYVGNFGLLASSMYINPVYYASKYSLGFNYTYQHYGVTEVKEMNNYQTSAFSNAMGNDGYTMSLANRYYKNKGYFFVYLK